VKDPQFDITITNKLNKHYGSLDFGIDPDVEVLNPITNEKCTRRFQFRFNDILQAIRAFDADGYDISYD
jgi:hypothetical protein